MKGRSRGCAGLALGLLTLLLAACASLPADAPRPPSHTLVARPDDPLAVLARQTEVPAGRTAVRALPNSPYALDARLTLIRQARVSLDLQTYLIGNDSTGRLLLRELRDAAARGVRVRVLLDDFYTDGMTELLLGLAAQPGVELRLFNPFAYGRDTPIARLWNLLNDFGRLNQRMHNKLFVADGVAAIVGGRNLADEYFFRSQEGNFIDFEMLAVGALVPQLGAAFDSYWNSEHAWPVQAVAHLGLDDAARRDLFNHLTAADAAPPPPVGPDLLGVPPLSQTLLSGRHQMLVVDAGCHADPPGKIGRKAAEDATVMSHFMTLVHEARSSLVLFSPYFVPGPQGLESLREARRHGIEVAVVTNALGASDEPLVSLGYGKYREQMLGMGVQLYEISSARLHRDREIGRLLGSSVGRLHAKVALVDRRMVLLGSMNMDPRSARTNTELGIAVRSPAFAEQVARALRVDDRRTGVFEVRLKPDGAGLQWVGRDADGEQTLDDEPEATLWQRLRLKLMSLLVPEDLL
jgi:phosphatidylserine/phosphatidylglycerophosphate/cardiolipin synthase-like enzyme